MIGDILNKKTKITSIYQHPLYGEWCKHVFNDIPYSEEKFKPIKKALNDTDKYTAKILNNLIKSTGIKFYKKVKLDDGKIINVEAK